MSEPQTIAELAHSVLDTAANEQVLARVAKAEAAGGEWILDPQVTRVVGFIAPGSAFPKVQVIVWVADEDFECDEEWLYSD
jgi:hypothetical protein